MRPRSLSLILAFVWLLPHPAAASCDIIAVSAGGLHSLAVGRDGTLWGWGGNTFGQVGNGNPPIEVATPVRASLPGPVIAAAAGDDHSLAVTSDGHIWGFGANPRGQLGDGTTNNSAVPVATVGISSAVAVSAGFEHSVALLQDGTVWTWGDNSSGQLGIGTFSPMSTVPVAVVGLPAGNPATSIVASGLSTFALLADGTLWAWGDDGQGVLGDGSTNNTSSPVRVYGLPPIAAIEASNRTAVAAGRDGTFWAWGDNASGPYGDGTTTASYVPVQATALSGIVAVACGYGFSVVVKSDGTALASGVNNVGQLGDGTTAYSWSHLHGPVVGLTGLRAVSSGKGHTLALASDGSVWAWGDNGYGKLGNGTFDPTLDRVPSALDPTPADLGDVLRAVRADVDVHLDFPAPTPSASWRVYRDTDKLGLGTNALMPDVTATTFVDPGAVTVPPAVAFYRVKGLSRCSSTPGP